MIGSVSSINGLYGTATPLGDETTRQNEQTAPSQAVNNTQAIELTNGQSNTTTSAQQNQTVNRTQKTEDTQETENKDQTTTNNKGLTKEQLAEIQQLVETDRKVRAHEQAHMNVGGNLVRGGANYQYDTGPDKKRYAVAGEVQIDTSEADTPEATIQKGEHIRRTALAPADPSAQDLRVAAAATNMIIEAQNEVRKANNEDQSDSSQSENQNQQTYSSPVLEAMLKEVYQNASSSSTEYTISSILGPISG